MKTRTIFKVCCCSGLLVAGILIGGLAVASAAEPAASEEAIHYSPGVADVLKMLDAKVEPSVIKAYIKSASVAYNPSASEIIALKQHGVPDDLITGMLERGAEVRVQVMKAMQAGEAAAAAATATANQVSSANPYPSPEYYGTDYGTTTPVYSDYGYPYYSYPYYGYPYSYGYSYWYPWYPFYFAYGFHHFHDHDGHFHDGHFHDGHSVNHFNNFAGRNAAFGTFRGVNTRASFAGAPRMLASRAAFSGGFHGGFSGGFHGGGGGGFHGGGGGHAMGGGGHR